MNPERLRQIANKVNEDKAAKVLQEKEEQERQKQEAEKALENERLLEWPKYIEDKIEKAAAQGESSYEFEVGDCGERVLSELFIHFASLNPSTSWALRKQVINYDMGTYQEFTIKVVTFRW